VLAIVHGLPEPTLTNSVAGQLRRVIMGRPWAGGRRR
jgi:hypothetical protein